MENATIDARPAGGGAGSGEGSPVRVLDVLAALTRHGFVVGGSTGDHLVLERAGDRLVLPTCAPELPGPLVESLDWALVPTLGPRWREPAQDEAPRVRARRGPVELTGVVGGGDGTVTAFLAEEPLVLTHAPDPATAMDRLVDAAALWLGLDPADVVVRPAPTGVGSGSGAAPDPGAEPTEAPGRPAVTEGPLRASAARVGIIGAGQLALMTHEAALRLGVEVRVLAAGPDDPAARAVPDVRYGDPTDPAAVEAFAADCDVVTVDHELVDVGLLARLEQAGVEIWPSSRTLAVATSKAAQRLEFAADGLPVPRHELAFTPEQVVASARSLGFPVVAKVASGGYDGRGVRFLEEPADVERWGISWPTAVVLEPVLDIEAELAVQVVRSRTGETVVYPVARTVQHDGMCRLVTVPAGVGPELEAEAVGLARRVAELVDAVGVLALELFVVDGGLVVNEIAARPHNSAHHTIEACVTSQFENHLRAVLGLPLGDTALVAPAAAMANVVGPSGPAAVPVLPTDVAVHLYGKRPRPGRKLGHVTALGDDVETAARRALRAAAAAAGEAGEVRP